MNSRNRITPPPLVPGQFIPFTRQRSYYGLPGTVYREFTTKLPAASFIWSRADEIYRNLILGMLLVPFLIVTGGYPRVRNCGTICLIYPRMRTHGPASTNPFFCYEPA